MKFGLLATVFLICLTTSALSEETVSKKLQGHWTGTEGDANVEATFDGDRFHFSSSTGEWYKGTCQIDATTTPKQLIVTINDCPIEQFKGLTSHAIFQLDGDSLRLCGCRPGDPAGPTGFDDPRGRSFTLNKQK